MKPGIGLLRRAFPGELPLGIFPFSSEGKDAGGIFDEFGMWLHLGGSYWQRTSVDAVIVVAAVIGLIAYAPSLERCEKKHFRAFVALLVGLVGFVYVIFSTGTYIGNLYGPKLRELELSSSP